MLSGERCGDVVRGGKNTLCLPTLAKAAHQHSFARCTSVGKHTHTHPALHTHLPAHVHHVRCLQFDVEVQPQLPTEAVQGAEGATGQQHTARNTRQAPVHVLMCTHNHAESEPTQRSVTQQITAWHVMTARVGSTVTPCTQTNPATHPHPPIHTPHLNTTAGLRHHRQNLKAQEVVAAAQPIVSAKLSVEVSGRRRSRRPLCVCMCVVSWQ